MKTNDSYSGVHPFNVVIDRYQDEDGYNIALLDLPRRVLVFSPTGDERLALPVHPEDIKGTGMDFRVKRLSKTTGRPIRIPITARNYKEYDLEVQNFPFTPNTQIVEIGAGLGDFVPSIVREKVVSFKPIVIDPAPYEKIQKMLEHALNIGPLREVKDHIKELIGRCKLIQDSSKVFLVNEPLETAVQDITLQNQADVVVDNYGPAHHSQASLQLAFETPCPLNTISDLERKLLKRKGILLQASVYS